MTDNPNPTPDSGEPTDEEIRKVFADAARTLWRTQCRDPELSFPDNAIPLIVPDDPASLDGS